MERGILAIVGFSAALVLLAVAAQSAHPEWFTRAKVPCAGESRLRAQNPSNDPSAGPSPPLVVRARRVGGAGYAVAGCGVGTYRGTYRQVAGETRNGKPVYRLGGVAGRPALYWHAWGVWVLAADADDAPAPVYSGRGPTLPANPWSLAEGADTGLAP